MSEVQNNPNDLRATDAKSEPVSLGEYNGFEIYPMPMFATLSVPDVSAVSQWYAKALGFGVVFQGPPMNGQPSMVHLRRKKYQDILLVSIGPTANSAAPASLSISFQTDDVDALASQAHAAAKLGDSSVVGPVETPWNTRDLRVTDPTGHRLVFTSHNKNADPKQVERMKQMLEAGRKQGGGA